MVVDSHVKKVQHPTGGVVGEILVRDGDRVRAGDVVVRLDETVAKANLAMVDKSLDELCARQARLEAERDGLTDDRVPVAAFSAAWPSRSCSALVGGRAAAVREPARGARGPEGAAAGADRAAAGADRRHSTCRPAPRRTRSS